MTDKNPYENLDDEIKDFSSKKQDDIDHSFFNLSDDEDDDEYENEEDEEESEPDYRRVRQELIIFAIVMLAVFLLTTVISLVYGSSKNKAYNNLKVDYEAYVAKTNASETALNAQIADLKRQIEELSKDNDKQEVPEGGASYKIVATNGINVRNDVGSNFWTNYNNLPENVKSLCDSNGDQVTIANGTIVTILETKVNGSDTWGKIADNAWICIKLGNDDLAVKQ